MMIFIYILFLQIWLTKCAPLRKVEDEKELSVIVTRGGWLLPLPGVMIFTEEHKLSFVLPDVPDPLKQLSGTCFREGDEGDYCTFTNKTNLLNAKSFQLLGTLNKILTMKGLTSTGSQKISLQKSVFSIDPSQPSKLAISEIITDDVDKLWVEELVEKLEKRRPELIEKSSRSKRVVPALFKALSVAAPHMGKIGKLFGPTSNIIKVLMKAKKMLPSALSSFSEFFPKVSLFQSESSESIKDLVSVEEFIFGDSSKLRKRASTRAIMERSDGEGLFWHQQETNADISNLIYTTLLYNIHLSTLQECRNRNIPIAFVPPILLQERLTSLQDAISKTNSLVISPADVMEFYSMKKTDCLFDNDGGIAQIAIPTIPKNAQYKIYEYKSIVFAWKSLSCTINVPAMFVVKDIKNNIIYPVTSVDEETCNPRTTNECLVPKKTADDTEHLCMKTLLQGGSAHEVRQACVPSCIESNQEAVSQLTGDTFVIAHLPEEAEIQCGSQKPSSVRHGVWAGAVQIKLPCGCELRHKEKLIAKSDEKDCSITHGVSEIQHILPSILTTLDDFVLESTEGIEESKYTHATEIINHNWEPPMGLNYDNDIKYKPDFPLYIVFWNAMQGMLIMYILWRLHLSPGMVAALFRTTEAHSKHQCILEDHVYNLLYLIVGLSVLGFLPQFIYFIVKWTRKLFWRAIHNVAETQIQVVSP